MAHDTHTPPVITIDDYKRDDVCQFTHFASANNANLSCSSKDPSVGKPELSDKDNIWQSAMPVHCCMTAITARQDKILNSSTNHLRSIRRILGRSCQEKMSNADSMYCVCLPVCSRCSDNADCDGWVMTTVWRIVTHKDNRARRRSAAIPADLRPRMGATSVIKCVTHARVSSAKATRCFSRTSG